MATSVSDRTASPPPATRAPALDAPPGGRRWATAGVLVAAAATVAAWLPLLHAPLTPDEGGFLLLARHWSPGSSLYGDYWVDRPPLLLWLFSLAGHLGTTGTTELGMTAPGVKVLGALASGAAVLLVGVLARACPGTRWSRVAAAVVTAALLSSPLFGMPETDGEVLAVPFVLLGVVCLIAALRNAWAPRVAVLASVAGASGMSAALVKQNVVDVFVFAIVLVWLSRHRVSRLSARVAAFASGAGVVLAAAVAGAWAQGTSPARLWDAVVVFRLHASSVIRSSASEATPERMAHLTVALVGSGAAVVLVGATSVVVTGLLQRTDSAPTVVAEPSAAPRQRLGWPVVALVLWELCGVALGASYWLHYLTGLVPGLAMMLAIAHPRRWPRRLLTLAVAYTAAAGVAMWAYHLAAPENVSPDAQVIAYLRGHAQPSDGVVVGFGHPDIVVGSGLQSPYEHLWSLPVRVRDPELAELQQVMASPAAPRWIVVAGDSLDTWGVDGGGADQYLRRHYVEQVTYVDWHIWLRRRDLKGATR